MDAVAWVYLRAAEFMVPERDSAAVSEQFLSFDAVLQWLTVDTPFIVQFTGENG